MKRNFIFLSIIICSISSCSDNTREETVIDMLPETRSILLTNEQKSFVNKNNEFSANLFKKIVSSDNSSSKIVSPLSASFILAMLNNGASGQTSEEISSLLGFEDVTANNINEYCKKLIEEAPEIDTNVKLNNSNIVATNSNFSIKLDSVFEKKINEYYHAKIVSLDFSSSKDKNNINIWCKEQTDGAITEMTSLLSPTSVIALLNAVSFKASWTHKFNSQATKNEQFILKSGESVLLPTMQQKVLVRYYANDIYSMVQLPYGSGDKWSMYILLPNIENSIEDAVTSLCKQNLSIESSYWNLEKAIVDIKIPKYTTECDLDLKDAISQMGAPTMFTDKADFTKMTGSGHNLSISLFEQKVKANVDEDGTEMASVTVAGLSQSLETSGYPSVEFYANRPFVYFIREASSGAIFFIGTYQGK